MKDKENEKRKSKEVCTSWKLGNALRHSRENQEEGYTKLLTFFLIFPPGRRFTSSFLDVPPIYSKIE